MDKAYRYTANTAIGETTEGIVIGPTEERAAALLMEAGLEPLNLSVDPDKTFQVMFSSGFNQRELSRMYRSLGRRIESGGNIIEGVYRLAKFVEDVRLSAALNLTASAMRSGATLGEAMHLAGFPERDAMAIEAMAESGRIDEVLISLADDVDRAGRLRASLKKIFMTPMMFGIIAYLLAYGAFGFLVPKMLGKVIEIIGEGELSPYSQMVYHLSMWANDNLMLFTLLAIGVAVGFAMFVKSDFVRQWFMTHISILDKLSQYADHARLWRSFALLYEAGSNPATSAEMIGRSALRTDNQERFLQIGDMMRRGMELDQAVIDAQFPEFVQAAVGGAVSQQGNIPDALIRFSNELYEDVELLSDKLKDTMSVLMTFFMGFVLLGFFMVTYYPMLSAVMGQL